MHAAFLADVLEQPADDAPRLVYADWLEENGEPERAEFIRTQIRLAGLDEDDDEHGDLARREWELLTRHRATWETGLPAWARQQPATFRRGFVAVVSVTAGQFLKDGDRLLRAAPLESVRIRGSGDTLARLGPCPHLRRLTRVDLSGSRMSSADLLALVRSRHAEALTGLVLRGCTLQDDALACLADWPGLSRITHLDLGSNDFSSPALARFFASSHLTGLRRLELGHLRFGANLVRPLAGCPGVANLEHLGLSNCLVGADAVRLLDRSPHLGKLTSLDLRGNLLQRGALATLAAAPLLSRLKALDLSDTGLTAEALAGLLPVLGAGRLRRLRLDQNHLSPLGTVFTDARWESVRGLSIRFCDLDRGDALALAGSAGLCGLTRLDLFHNEIGRTAAAAIVVSPHLAGLRELDLAGNPVGDESVQALAESPSMSGLWRLSLGSQSKYLTPAAVTALAESAQLGQLTHLALSGESLFGPAARTRVGLTGSLLPLFRLPRLLLVEANNGTHQAAVLRPTAQ